jgi:ribulose 1,5-bisphosphate synthetase/thiazole synthase
MKYQQGQKFKRTQEIEVSMTADIVVAGGGTAGITAAIAAARNGADVLIIEKNGYLGGLMTAGNMGLTTYIVHEKDNSKHDEIMHDLAENPDSVHVAGGLAMEITRHLEKINGTVSTKGQPGTYVFTSQGEFKYLLMSMAKEAGVRMLFHTMVTDVVKSGSAIDGVIVENKSGCSMIAAKQFIDATGDGDLACLADVPYFKGVGPYDISYAENPETLGKMGAFGVMFRLGNIDMDRCLDHLNVHKEMFEVQRVAIQSYDEVVENHRNNEMTCFVINVEGIGGVQIYNTPMKGVYIIGCPCITGDGTNAEDLSMGEILLTEEVMRYTRILMDIPGFEESCIVDIPEIGVRETRHIYGDYLLTIEDIMTMKAHDDSIGCGSHPIDISPRPSYMKDELLPERFYYEIPFRSLIAKGVDNLLLAGRCISCTHEASGCTRVTVQCMITGEAAGTAAALCSRDSLKIRELDIELLKRTLVGQNVKLTFS